MRTKQLSMDVKLDILKRRKEGKSIRTIANELGKARTTVWNILKKHKTTGVLTSGHRTGRPRKTTAADDQLIIKAMKKNPQTTVSKITNTLHLAGVKVSESTVRRRLQEKEYRYRCKDSVPIASLKEEDGLQFVSDPEMRDKDLKEDELEESLLKAECLFDVSSDLYHDETEKKTDLNSQACS